MRRAVAALGTAALLALVLVGGRDARRSSARSTPGENRAASAASAADGPGEIRGGAAPAAESPGPVATLGPGEVAIRMLDVETHKPVAALEGAIRSRAPEEERRARTNEDGVAAWGGIAPGLLEVRIPDPRYRMVAGQPNGLHAELASRPVTIFVERTTTLRLRFAHDDGTPVGAVIDNVTGKDRCISETTAHGTDVLPSHEWIVRTGDAVELWAMCEDGYETETALTCEGWPVDERTIYLRPAAPRGRSLVRIEVVAEETGKPIADAAVECFYSFACRHRGGFRCWEEATDRDGIAVFDNLPTAGVNHLSAWTRGRRRVTEVVALEPGSPLIHRFVLPLCSGPAIRGSCPDRPNARIVLDNRQGNWRSTTDLVQREFAFDDLEPGEYTVTACDGDDTASVTTVAGGPPVRLSFPPLGKLVLDCRDNDGRVPKWIDVVLERGGERRYRNGLTAGGGRFALEVSQGPVRISVTAPGYRTTPFVPLHVVGDAVNEATVPLGDPLPILDVQVVDPSGAPVPGVSVWLWSGTGNFEFYDAPRNPAETSLDGWARFVRSDAPAEYRVSAGIDAAIGDPPEPTGPRVRVGTTGRVTTTLVAVPLPRVWAESTDERLPGGLLSGDLLVEWNGQRLRLDEEVPTRWTEPVAVKVRREGEEIERTLPPMTRSFHVHQALLPPPPR